MQEESTIEERMDFAMLSSAIEPAVTMKTCVSRPSMEEQELWDNSTFSNEIFNAGINHTAAAAEERKRLELEATKFDLWNGADFLPEEDSNDGELLLDELEQGDILTELLRSMRMYISQFHPYTFQFISYFWIDVNLPEGADILEEEAQSRPKASEAWAPYESKMVSQPFNTQTDNS